VFPVPILIDLNLVPQYMPLFWDTDILLWIVQIASPIWEISAWFDKRVLKLYWITEIGQDFDSDMCLWTVDYWKNFLKLPSSAIFLLFDYF
jgi:hypothetical protein